MKVIFATHFSYLPQRTGGSESSTHDLCMALLSKGIQPGVICTLMPNDAIWLKNRVWSKLTGRKFIRDDRLPYPVFRGYDVKAGLGEIITSFEPDVVVAQAGNPFDILNWCSSRKIPAIFYARDIAFHRNEEDLEINSYLGVIANSEFTRKKLRDEFDIDAIALPPYVDPTSYRVPTTRQYALHVGLVQEKGIELSFSLAERRPDIDFHFVESWPITKAEISEFRTRAKKLGNVKISSRVADMRDLYSSAKIVLAPSVVDEAWGRVVTEAHFSGIPVIASGKGGLPESVGSGGIIVSNDDNLDDWSEALSRLWDNDETYAFISAEALRWSKRPEITKEFIVDSFIRYVESHVQKISRQS